MHELNPLHVSSQVLHKELIKLEIGDFISYEQLSGYIGNLNVQKRGRCYLNTARKLALNLDSMVFETIRNKGVQRMNESEKVRTTSRYFGKVRRAIKRGSRQLQAAEYNDLSIIDKRKYNTQAGLLGTLSLVSAHTTMRAIEKKQTPAHIPERFTIAEITEMFKGM